MISSQSVPLLAILASSLTLTCLSLIKSTLYPNLVIFISETFVEFVIFFLSLYSHSTCKFTCLQQTWLFQFTLLWHLTSKSQQTSTHSKFIGTCHYKYFKTLTHHINTQKLHWLPIKQRIDYKTCLFTYKTLTNQQPTYLYNSLSFPSHSVSTRSSDSLVLSIPYVRPSLGKRAFSVIGPRLWNSLPPDTLNSSFLPIFRSRLKTHLFKIAFPP